MKIGMIGPMTKPYPEFNDLICKFFYGPKRLEIIQQMYTWVQAAERITTEQCKQFVTGGAYNYISGAGSGAGGGVGLLPTRRMKPEQLKNGIVSMTKSHASKVLSLLYAALPSAWSAPKLTPTEALVQQIMGMIPGSTVKGVTYAIEAANGNFDMAIELAKPF